MSSNKANKPGLKVLYQKTSSAYIAKVKDFASKIIKFNSYIKQRYQIQPLLILLPFAAGVLVHGIIGNFGSNNSTPDNDTVTVATAGISGNSHTVSNNKPVKLQNELLVAQADTKDDIKKEEGSAKEKSNQIKIPEEVRKSMSPDELKIIELFAEMSEIQEEKGMDSPDLNNIKDELSTLIEKVETKKKAEKAETAPDTNENSNSTNKTIETTKPETTPNKAKPANNIKPKINGKVNPPSNIKDKIQEKLNEKNKNTLRATPPKPAVRTSTKTVTAKPVTTPKSNKEDKATEDKKVVPTQPTEQASEEKTEEVVEIEKLPSDEIRVTTDNDVIDIKTLLETVGKELELNFWYEDGQYPSSTVMLQQYGSIKREELLPLLTSVLAKCSEPYMMVKEGPYTKIIKMKNVQTNTGIFSPELDENYENMDDTIVASVVALENIDYESTLKPILDKFIPSSDIITPIPNTNKIVIADYSRNLKRITEIINMVDVAGPKKKLEIIVPNYLRPDDTKTILQDMYNKLYGEDGVSDDGSGSSEPEEKDPNRFAGMSPAERARAVAAERRQQAINNARNRNKTQTQSSSSSETGSSSITVDKRTGRLFVIGTETEIKNIKHILSLFDVPKGGQQVELKIYSPVYLDSQNAVEKIQKLMKAINEEQAEQEMAESPETTPIPQPAPATNSRTSRNTPRRSTAQSTDEEQVEGMFMLVDDRTNRIIILGWKEQIEQFEELLALFDVPLPGGEITLQILKLENTEAADTVSKVKELISAINEQSTGKAPGTNSITGRSSSSRQRRPSNNESTPQSSPSTQGGTDEEDSGPFMLADERLNRILIVGVQEQIDQAKELVEIIDQEWPNSEVKLKIFTFDVVEVEAITDQITQLIEAMSVNDIDSESRGSVDRSRSSDIFGTNNRQQNRNSSNRDDRNSSPTLQQAGDEGPFLMADNRLNRLFVVGMEDQIEQVSDMIMILDKSIGLDLQIIPQFKYILSSEAADQIAKLLAVLHEQEEPQTGSGGSSSSNRYNNRNNNNNNRNSTNTLDDRTDRSRSTNRGTNSGYNRRDGIASIIEVSQRGPFLLPDDRTNRLLVVSTDEQYSEIVDLLPIIDVPPSKHDNMTLQIHQLKYVPVSDVRDILDDLELTQTSESLDDKYMRYGPGNNRTLTGQQRFDPITGQNQNIVINDWEAWTNIEEPIIYVAQHEPTNRLFIYATLYQHEEISEMIKVIDVEPDDTLGQVRVFKMRNQEPSVISEAITKLYIEPLEKQNKVTDEDTNLKGLEVAPTVHELADIFSVAVRGSKRQLEEIESIINDIDVPMPQVLIEASLIKISLDDSFKLGVSLKDVFDMPDGSSISGTSPFSFDGITIGDNNVATAGSSGTVAFFNEGFVYAALEAINSNTNSEISSMPRVLTLDNKEATITSSTSRPIQRTTLPVGSDTPITEVAEWKEAGTTLSVTPHIGVFDDDPENSKAFLRLEITLDVDNFIGEGNDTSTANNNITSHINIPNGAYIILGGLTQTSWTETENKIPILGDIPILGAAFRNISKTKGRTVLYVFVKAEIVSDQNFDQLKELSRINKEKMELLQENFNEMPIIPGFKPERRERETLN